VPRTRRTAGSVCHAASRPASRLHTAGRPPSRLHTTSSPASLTHATSRASSRPYTAGRAACLRVCNAVRVWCAAGTRTVGGVPQTRGTGRTAGRQCVAERPETWDGLLRASAASWVGMLCSTGTQIDPMHVAGTWDGRRCAAETRDGLCFAAETDGTGCGVRP